MMKIIESPREAMQGFSRIIPTKNKVDYINLLLRSGFNTVEVGSIVSPKLIPQMADSLDVLRQLDLSTNASHIMFLAVHDRGVEKLADLDAITHISFPFSFSPTFLKLNVNSTVERSLETVELVTGLCSKKGKQAVIYISMAFGNPYDDPWDIDLLTGWVARLRDAGARTIMLSNVSVEIDAALIDRVYRALTPAFPDMEIGLHLHTANVGWQEKVEAAWRAGCRRFDGVMAGWGGCPMAGKEMLGNLRTENLVEFARQKGIITGIDPELFGEASSKAAKVFGKMNIE